MGLYFETRSLIVLTALLSSTGCRFGFDWDEKWSASYGLGGADGGDGDGTPIEVDPSGDGDGDGDGVSSSGSGSTSSGGTSAGGNDGTGSSSSDGGMSSGGAPGDGGSGGVAAGGSGAMGSGGAGDGGSNSGGAGSGGAGSGGSNSGGAGSGGAGSGGSGGLPDDLIVTTAADEEDVGASVASPGQTGLSLREAINIANNQAGPQTISFAQSYNITLTRGVLPDILQAVEILGSVTINASGVGGTDPCLVVNTSDVILNSLAINNCPMEPILLASGSGNEVSQCSFSNSGQSLAVAGDGPLIIGNLFDGGGGAGIWVNATNPRIVDNHVEDVLGHGIWFTTTCSGAEAVGNTVVRSAYGIGLEGPSNVRILHNTLYDSLWSALGLGSASNVEVRNNIFFSPLQWGIEGSTSQLWGGLSHNLYFDTPWGWCSACTPSNQVTSSPLFVDPGGRDYSLQAGSPAINKGTPVGEDRNGAGAGDFNGAAPDLGAHESN